MDRYAVVGNPIAHSKSPEIHSLFAEASGQELTYEKILIELGHFKHEVSSFFALGGKGLNVTVPFKEEAFKFADELSERAKLAGAVNTLVAKENGTIYGDTTDGAGLVADLKRLGVRLNEKSILVLGAGGAVRGVLQDLLNESPADIVIANRTVAKAETLAQNFAAVSAGKLSASSYDDLTGWNFDVVINGTSASLSGAVPNLPEGLFKNHAAAYDMVYGDDKTAFMRWAESAGAQTVSDGLGMLVGQAAESFYLWRGLRPDVNSVIKALRFKL